MTNFLQERTGAVSLAPWSELHTTTRPPIQETRLLGDKYQETKLIGLQVRASQDLTDTERIGNVRSC